jgi:hypothetical protein
MAANLALLAFIATKGKKAFTDGYLSKEDFVFFAQLASTANLKEQRRNDVWMNSVLAGHLCTYYLLLKKHDDLYAIFDRVIDYEMAAYKATGDGAAPSTTAAAAVATPAATAAAAAAATAD